MPPKIPARLRRCAEGRRENRLKRLSEPQTERQTKPGVNDIKLSRIRPERRQTRAGGPTGAAKRRMIEFENVSKSFWTGKKRKIILDRASFRVEIGNSLGILARNGAGKTTIINMMAGLEKPDEGRVTRSSRISFPLGFMGGVVNKHTATENSRYIARLYGLDPDYVESFCRWLCGLEEYFEMPIGT